MTSAPTATFTITQETRVRSGLSRVFLSRDGILVALLVLLVLVACLAVPRFASPVTTGYLLSNAVPALLIALPMTLIIITGEIDLSVASIVAMSTVTVGSLTTAGWPFGAAMSAAVVVGVVAGAVANWCAAETLDSCRVHDINWSNERCKPILKSFGITFSIPACFKLEVDNSLCFLTGISRGKMVPDASAAAMAKMYALFPATKSLCARSFVVCLFVCLRSTIR